LGVQGKGHFEGFQVVVAHFGQHGVLHDFRLLHNALLLMNQALFMARKHNGELVIRAMPHAVGGIVHQGPHRLLLQGLIGVGALGLACNGV
jgi:hypothetical protein